MNEFVIGENILNKWQQTINLLSEIFQVPSALVMRLNPSSIEVFVSSEIKKNPYNVGDSEALKDELYCEHAISNNTMLEVPNALKDKDWENNPDIKLNMISYLGLPIKNPDGSTFGTICVLDEIERNYSLMYKKLITQYRNIIEDDIKMAAELHFKENMTKQIMDMNSMKDKLISIISHDLRNPLNSILGYLKLLQSDINTLRKEQIIEIVNNLINDSDNLYSFTNELIEWSLQLKSEIVNITKINLTELINESLVQNEAQANYKSITVTNEVSNNVIAYADENMIKTVLRNLISNALKFSYANSEVIISSRLIDGFQEIIVSDNGVGISTEKLNLLFKSENNNSSLGTIDEIGTGFGLILCKDFVEQNNGTIRAENNKNGGSDFIFSVPSVLIN